MDQMSERWKIKGFDTFDNESYPIGNTNGYDTEEDARSAALLKLGEIEIIQPTESSGGHDFGGIQDKIYIVRPDRSEYLFED